MRTALLEKGLLERDGRPLRLDIFHEDRGHVMEGVLWGIGDEWYPIERGVPCLLRGPLRPNVDAFQKRHRLPPVPNQPASPSDEGRLRTTDTFSDKWRRFRRYGMEPREREFLLDWYCQKLGLEDRAALVSFYRSKDLILEVGPGSGFNSRFMAEQTSGQVVAVDVSEAALTTFENTHDLANCHVIRADLMDLPLPDDRFDFVIADGVLHHTPDTERALAAIYGKVKPGGELFAYVYRRMGAARAFCDEYVRREFSRLSAEECYRACEGLTELGRELSHLNAKVHLEKGVPVLGIPPGTHDVQRLLYYNFLKCYWNEAFDYETNNMVNLDWYHPHHAWQHTEDEVRSWLEKLGVRRFQFNPANPNGISVLLERPR